MQVDFAWTLATSEDLKHPTTDGQRSESWTADMFAAYFQQVWFASIEDERVKMVYLRVGNMLDDVSAVLAPEILLGVVLYRIRRLLGIGKVSQLARSGQLASMG